MTSPERELREALIHTALVLEGNAEYWLGLHSEDGKHHGRWLVNIAEECRAKAAAPAPTPAPPTHNYALFEETMDTPHTDTPGKTCWCGFVNTPAEPVVPEREPQAKYLKDQEVWVRGIVVSTEFLPQVLVTVLDDGDDYTLECQQTDIRDALAAAPRAAGGQREDQWEPWRREDGTPLVCGLCGDEIPKCEHGWHGMADMKVVYHTDCSYQDQIKKLRTALEYYAEHADGGTGVAEKALAAAEPQVEEGEKT